MWKPGESVYMQFITYPAMRRSNCPTICAPSRFQRLPEKADYMTTAHYTDKAIGDRFVAYLNARRNTKKPSW